MTTASAATPGRRSWAFWLGSAAVSLGVAAHVPEFFAMADMGYAMAGMPMSPVMLGGMGLILVGLPLCLAGLLQARPRASGESRPGPVVVWDAAQGLNGRHCGLIAIMAMALLIDMMKPALLGFVAPGLAAEYGLTRRELALLPMVALTGTAIGSMAWGVMADLVGRRAAILFAAIFFIGTSICGSMPTFEGNLVMCFLMGTSAGGMLPIALALVSETTPPRHRGWVLVLLGAVGAFGGYVAASGSAALLEPTYGWRILWLLGLPTGVLLIALSNLIPESPGFLAQQGRLEEAARIARAYGGSLGASEAQTRVPEGGGRGVVSRGLILTGASLASGLITYGFLLWLPSDLRAAGFSALEIDRLLFASAMITLPTAAGAAWIYRRWDGRPLLVGSLAVMAIAFAWLRFGVRWEAGSEQQLVAWLAVVMIANGCLSAVVLPYAVEVVPQAVRGRWAGAIAGSGKGGGLLVQLINVAGFAPRPATFSGGLAVVTVVAALACLLVRRPGVGRTGEASHPLSPALPARD